MVTGINIPFLIAVTAKLPPIPLFFLPARGKLPPRKNNKCAGKALLLFFLNVFPT
jgi:hypothetical protein